jgi:hypothetical protein
MLRSLQKFSRIELPAATTWVGVGEGQMEEDCGRGQDLRLWSQGKKKIRLGQISLD